MSRASTTFSLLLVIVGSVGMTCHTPPPTPGPPAGGKCSGTFVEDVGPG